MKGIKGRLIIGNNNLDPDPNFDPAKFEDQWKPGLSEKSKWEVAAGIGDGNGCLQIHKGSPNLTISICSRDKMALVAVWQLTK